MFIGTEGEGKERRKEKTGAEKEEGVGREKEEGRMEGRSPTLSSVREDRKQSL